MKKAKKENYRIVTESGKQLFNQNYTEAGANRIWVLTNRKEKTYNIPKKGVQVMDEEMTAIEMQRFLNQQYAEGKTELEAYRNLMAILGLSYPQKSEKEK